MGILAGYNGALVGCALTIFQPAVPFLPPALSALPFRHLIGRIWVKKVGFCVYLWAKLYPVGHQMEVIM